VLSQESVLVKLERLLRRVAAKGQEKNLIVRVAPDVAVFILEMHSRRLAEFEKRFRLQVDLKDDPALKRGEMRIISARTRRDITSAYDS